MSDKIRKYVLPNLPYLFVFWFFSKIGTAYRIAPGTDFGTKLMGMLDTFPKAFETYWPGLGGIDLLVGLAGAAGVYLLIQSKIRQAKKFRRDAEYGTARFGTKEDIKPFVDPKFQNNVILTGTEFLTMNTRPKIPANARNLNACVIGSSGSGKTRFWLTPQLLQAHSSYVVVDPKGGTLDQCGRFLQREKYRVRVFNSIDFSKSMHYNPLAYIKTESDVLKFVTALIANTKGDGKEGDEFWTKAETLLYCALVSYIVFEGPEEERNMNTLVEMINSMEVREDDETFKNAVDYMFDGLERRSPQHFAVRQYKKYKLASGKTAKSILISLGVRLEKFNLPQIAAVVCHDELNIPALGEHKTALFAVIPDNDSSLNFIIGMMYSSIFQELYYAADQVYGGRLPIHVHCVMDEFANVALPDEFDKLLATMRSREISVSIIIQNIAQLKVFFEKQWESIIGNCDEFIYLGGNETSTHKMISESYLGRATIDTNTYGKSTGRSGSYSTNYQLSGRELYTAGEVRMLDNRYALLFIRGEHPIQDEKYDILHHPNLNLTADGGMPPYMHGQALLSFDPGEVLLSGEYGDYEALSEEEIFKLYNNESEEKKDD